MVVPHAILPDLNTLDADSLRALLTETHERYCTIAQRLESRESEIEHLKLLLARLERMQFGRKSEKLQRQIEQLELRLEDLEQAQEAERERPAERARCETPDSAAQKKPARRPLPSHLPRVTRTHAPKEQVCPGCGGKLRPLGEDVSEMLEYVPAHFHVIRHVRPKLSCGNCELMCWSRSTVTIFHSIARPRSMPGPESSWSARH
jgi:transposase